MFSQESRGARRGRYSGTHEASTCLASEQLRTMGTPAITRTRPLSQDRSRGLW